VRRLLLQAPSFSALSNLKPTLVFFVLAGVPFLCKGELLLPPQLTHLFLRFKLAVLNRNTLLFLAPFRNPSSQSDSDPRRHVSFRRTSSFPFPRCSLWVTDAGFTRLFPHPFSYVPTRPYIWIPFFLSSRPPPLIQMARQFLL